MDFVGTMYGLWYYTGKPVPTMPAYLPWDFSLIPVMVMFFILYKPTSSPFIKAFIFASVSSFIAERDICNNKLDYLLFLSNIFLNSWSQ